MMSARAMALVAVNVADGLFAIAEGLHRIGKAIEAETKARNESR